LSRVSVSLIQERTKAQPTQTSNLLKPLPRARNVLNSAIRRRKVVMIQLMRTMTGRRRKRKIRRGKRREKVKKTKRMTTQLLLMLMK